MSTSEGRHPVAPRSQWLHEKAFTHHRDALAAARRALPWIRVERDYHLQGPTARHHARYEGQTDKPHCCHT